jgi:hypothetical protein
MDSKAAADSASRASVGATSKTSAAKGPAAQGLTASTNTITWTEPKTGRTLTLSGNVSVERLQELRKRIESERGSSGQKLP